VPGALGKKNQTANESEGAEYAVQSTNARAKGPNDGSGLSTATSNGEVEGPDDHARQGPRAQSLRGPAAPIRPRITAPSNYC